MFTETIPNYFYINLISSGEIIEVIPDGSNRKGIEIYTQIEKTILRIIYQIKHCTLHCIIVLDEDVYITWYKTCEKVLMIFNNLVSLNLLDRVE